MIQAIAQQQQAAADISANKMALAQATTPPANPPAPNTAGQQPAPATDAAAAANKLNQAMQNFAEAAEVTGQAAQEISGQAQVANEALAQALEAASQLVAPQAGEPAHPAPAGDSPSQTASSTPSGTPSQPAQAQMGKGLTPASPEATAQMMAGPQAMAQMQAAQSPPSPKPSGALPGGVPNAPMPGAPGQPAPSEVASQTPAEQSPMTAQNKVSGEVFVNDGKMTAADAALARLAEVKEDPWIAKLPAELRNAIRAEAQRPAPRGYEERLRNYFKNIE